MGCTLSPVDGILRLLLSLRCIPLSIEEMGTAGFASGVLHYVDYIGVSQVVGGLVAWMSPYDFGLGAEVR